MGVKTDLRSTYQHLQPTSADVVIIGGGIMGVSTAFHLASRGVKNIVLLERHRLGRGSSAKPMGGVRANFSDPNNVMLGQRSLESFRTFYEDFGTNIELTQVGYLFLARTEQEVADLELATKVQNELGVRSRMVDPKELVQINPFVDEQAVLAGSFSPDDGFACPAAAVNGYARACIQLGVTILDMTEVLNIETGPDGVRSVETNLGVISTDKVVCAAGAWSAAIGEMAGHVLPIEPVRRMIGITPQQPLKHPSVPFTLDLGTKMYWHNYYNGLLVGISHDTAPGFDRDFTFEWLDEFNAAASVVAPSLMNPRLDEGWAGLYENTPDRNAIIGASSRVPGFFYITGFSGHGFLQGPAAGEFMADIIQGKESFLPADAFSVDRFGDEDRELVETNII
ncbi:sarcosine oxidase subunit beta [Corynebacterium sp. HMSC30G07]|uniref:NAD(P)/FAD-dependent oxidoreductase n=1 Tax=Corynebacterium sp. HMSC30G07 TaxID=1581072 RepID=UPI0008A47AD0|nr:FAD-binding oxidoreductase [Corynebacterium sp. HMSC30G07]OFT73972.1 sarcosine oxidase subunit beta [Corynebacterium sp. HMSC30G07]